MKDQQQLADEYLADRAAQLHDFFVEFDNANSDASYLAEREQEVQPTKADWQAYRERRAAKDAALTGAF